jgi:Domain of unknown function (DUF4282)
MRLIAWEKSMTERSSGQGRWGMEDPRGQRDPNRQSGQRGQGAERTRENPGGPGRRGTPGAQGTQGARGVRPDDWGQAGYAIRGDGYGAEADDVYSAKAPDAYSAGPAAGYGAGPADGYGTGAAAGYAAGAAAGYAAGAAEGYAAEAVAEGFGTGRAVGYGASTADPFGTGTADPFGARAPGPFGTATADPFGAAASDPFGAGTADAGTARVDAEHPTATMPSTARQSSDAKGFLGALFDFGFTSFATPKVIKALYVLVMIGTVLSALVFTVLAFHVSTVFGILTLLFGDPLFIIIVMAIYRIILEFFVVIFRIAEDIQALRERGEAG